MANFSKTELEASLKCLDFSVIEKFFSDMTDVDADDPKYDGVSFSEYLADIEAMNVRHATASLPAHITDLLIAAFRAGYIADGGGLVDTDGNLIAGV